MSTGLATILLLGFAATAAASTSSTPFDLLDDGSIVVPVTIGGTGSYRFVLDTGSSRTVISTKLAKALHLPFVAKTVMVTPAGRDEAFIVRLEGLAVDGRAGFNLSAAVMPADRYAAGERVDGLIGQDVLSTLVYTIDYARRIVVWHAPGEILAGDRLPLNIRNNRILVSLAQHDGDRNPVSLVPDSGSDALVFFSHAKNKLALKLLDVGVLSSLSGSRLARRAAVDVLVIGRAQLTSSNAVVIDSDEPVEMMGDGLLPLNVFARVTFNVAAGYLIVQPR
jgi:hypothetical protein